MSYQKHNWVSNEIIRKTPLNNIEQGIYNEEQRAKEQEELLSELISDEVTRSTNRETVLAGTINTLNVTLTQKINTLNGDSTVEGSVDYKIEQATANAGGYKITLDHTAEVNPSTKYIYLEEDSTATGLDKFEEWIWYYNESEDTYSWRIIGEVSLDLSAYALKSELPTKTSDLTNDSGYEANVQADWNETDTSSDAYIQNKPTIPSGVSVDSALSTTSENPVQNKVITTELNNKASASAIPTKVSELTNDSGFTTNTGTVTSIATGAGLTGGTVTDSGTIKCDLKSETKSTLTAVTKGSTSNREYSVGLDSAGNLSVNVPWTDTRDFKLGPSRSGASNNTLLFIYT